MTMEEKLSIRILEVIFALDLRLAQLIFCSCETSRKSFPQCGQKFASVETLFLQSLQVKTGIFFSPYILRSPNKSSSNMTSIFEPLALSSLTLLILVVPPLVPAKE